MAKEYPIYGAEGGRKARVDYGNCCKCGTPIKKGDEYKFAEPMSSVKFFFCKKCKPDQKLIVDELVKAGHKIHQPKGEKIAKPKASKKGKEALEKIVKEPKKQADKKSGKKAKKAAVKAEHTVEECGKFADGNCSLDEENPQPCKGLDECEGHFA